MKKYLLFLFLIASVFAHAQTVIKGKVIDEKTKETLPGVSIYVNNSTIGTITNNDGEFLLSVPFSGKVELVASYLSYIKQVLIIENNDNNLITIALKPEPNTLNEVVIKATKNKSGNFDKWGALFERLLLGNNSHHFIAKIRNPQVLVFYFDQDKNELSVFARSSLIIENSVTNYRLKLEIDNFKYAFNTSELQTTFSTFFEEMKVSDSKKIDINNSRQLAYYGSQMHFMRMVKLNDLTRNGYKLYVYKSNKNAEKERITKLIQQKLNENSSTQSAVLYDIAKLFKNRDTAYYYKMIMKQDDILSADTTFTLIRNFSKFNRVKDVANFYAKDSLMVDYQMFNDRNNKRVKPEELAKWKAKNSKTKEKGSTTILYFTSKEGVNVQSTGYYPETGLFFFGDMFDRRVAQLLPWDYEP